jgi:putative protease
MTMPTRNPVELLAPAGNFEKLEVALHYGADAVYIGGMDFSLRKNAGNFSPEEMEHAVRFVHDAGRRVYVALNVFVRNADLEPLARYLRRLAEWQPDGLIVADPAVFTAARREAPRLPVHVSTQANVTSVAAARFWSSMGARRINAARELSIEEIREMVAGAGCQVEVFAHGAMCMAYSGRCLLSSFLAGRDGNRGDCAQSCRWRYTLTEEKRPGVHMPVLEHGTGTTILSARDLCMIRHLPDLLRTGVAAVKIEGRMKGIHYLAAVVRTYRSAIDAIRRKPGAYRIEPWWIEELEGVTQRGYGTGFYYGAPDPAARSVARPPKRRLAAKVVARTGQGRYRVDVRSPFRKTENLERVPRSGPPAGVALGEIRDGAGIPLERAVPGEPAELEIAGELEPLDLLRVLLPESDTEGPPPPCD